MIMWKNVGQFQIKPFKLLQPYQFTVKSLIKSKNWTLKSSLKIPCYKFIWFLKIIFWSEAMNYMIL